MAAGAVALGSGGLARAAPRGKVVRVQRSEGAGSPPRLCVVMDAPDSLLCIGEPKVGDSLAYMTQATGLPIGEGRIETVAPATRIGACPGKAPVLFDVTATITQGTVDQLTRSQTIVLRGIKLGSRVRAVHDYRIPDERAAEQLQIAMDIDGDSRVDLALYNYTCDAAGARSNGGRADRQCFDLYQDRGGRLVRTQHDNIELCY